MQVLINKDRDVLKTRCVKKFQLEVVNKVITTQFHINLGVRSQMAVVLAHID